MFKINNKVTGDWRRSGNFKLWTYFTPCSSVSIVNFEHVIAGWDVTISPDSCLLHAM